MELHLTWLDLLITAVLGGAVFLLIVALFRIPATAEPPIHRRTAVQLGADIRQTVFEHPLLSPLMARSLLIARRFHFQPAREHIREQLDGCGNPSGYTVDEYLAICLASGIALSLTTVVLTVVAFGQFEPTSPFIMAIIGFYIPLWVLRESSRKRITRISKQLPYTLDLISLTMGSGTTFAEAVDTIIRDNPEDAFNQELRIMRAEIDLGTPRMDALANMADRVPLESLRSVVGAVNQAEALGTPLAGILTSQAMMMRMHRSVRAEKLSASASLRILIPSMLILASVVIVMFGPFIIRYLEGGW